MTDKLAELVSNAESIGVIGSPSSTSELALDIMARAVNKKLVGELAVFRYLQDNNSNYALGQITEIKLRNIWHEDPTMRSLIRQRGRIDAVSERQDTHQGEMVISAVFADDKGMYRPSSLGTVPPTGTPVQIVDDNVLDVLLAPYADQVFYLGRVYGSTPKLPLWFKHFGTGRKGAGEAYHLGIFGKTGSGKSVLAKMIMLAYARHSQMGMFVFDPQGEFAMGLNQPRNDITSMGEVLAPSTLTRIGRKFEVYNLFRFRLGTWELFGELLTEFGFFGELGIKWGDYQTTAADYIVDYLRNDKKHKLDSLDDLAFENSLEHLSNNIHRIYSGKGAIEKIKGFIAEAKRQLDEGTLSPVKKKWDQAIEFFSKANNKVSIQYIIARALEMPQNGSRPLIVIDLSQKPVDISNSIWDKKIKPLLIDSFLSELIRQAERAYQMNKSLNTLVVLDEASRLAPDGHAENERKERIKNRLVDAVRTTRKYGLGWMFLSQTLSSLDREIVQQLRIFFFGFGLGMGTEFQALRNLVGGRSKALDLYQLFRDPQSSFDMNSREYSFMTIGPVSPLSFAGTPLFLNVFTNVQDFLMANQISP